MTIELSDDFGRTVKFEGTELAQESNYDGGKPRWSEVTVWRTEAGSYVVWWKTVDTHEDDESFKFETYPNPTALINGLAATRRELGGQRYHTRFAQAILAAISEADPAVAAEWMTVHIA